MAMHPHHSVCLRASLALLDALAELHALRIAHRDIKPSNILMDVSPEARVLLKLCDLGTAKPISRDTPSPSHVTAFLYRAPELMLGTCFYDTAVDVWSAGCVIAEMLLQHPLFLTPATEAEQLATLIRVFGLPEYVSQFADEH